MSDAPQLIASLALAPSGVSPAMAMAAAAGAALALAALRLLRGALRPGAAAADRAPGDAGGTGRAPQPAGPGAAALFRMTPGPALAPASDAAADALAAYDLPRDPACPAAAFARAFPADSAALEDALTALERGGDPFSLFLRGADGSFWSAHGGPEGGEAWVSLIPADPALLSLQEEAEDSRTRSRALDAALEALDNAPVMIWRRDAAGTLIWANASYRAFTDSPEDGPPRPLTYGAALSRLGMPVAAEEAAPPAHDDGAPHVLSLSEPRPEGRVALFQAGGGQRRWHEVSRIAAADGGRIGFAIDAGSTVIAESALRRFVETLTETFAHLRIGLAIFDHSRRLGLFNPAFAELMRLDPAWLAGRPRLDDVLMRLRENRMMPDRADFTAWRAELTELFNSPDAADYAELWHLPGDVTIRVLARPHPQGSLAFLFEDVSETAQLERRFATEMEIRRAVIDRLEEGVAAFGPDGGAQFANPAFARIWGFLPGGQGAPATLGAVIRRCRPLTAEAAPPPPAGAAARRAPPGRPRTQPQTAGPAPAPASDAPRRDEPVIVPRTEPEGDIWTRLAAFAAEGARRTAWSERVHLVDGRVLRARIATLPDGAILTAFSDVTGAEQAAAALEERNKALEAADEMRTALVEQTSRRIRTPLNAIGGHAQALRDAALPGQAGERAAAILNRAQELHDAIEGMSDLANAQTGALALHDGDVDLVAALDFVRERMEETAAERGVALALDIAPGVDRMPGDEARLRQILTNLVADALHRTPRGGVVLGGVRAGEAMDGTAAVELWSSTPEPAERSRRGLAHALARRLAELHGGRMRQEEIVGPEGRRVEVICALPLRAPAARGAEAAEGAED
ncbi:PAS-domain containing protein [Rhodovulum sp. DZ06]|uniref:PAS domain-containing sensor histidine kinase n=1 Tax=Rhodovulum sp. DZ06 TaxID=3425126 RepID=UPI003D346463